MAGGGLQRKEGCVKSEAGDAFAGTIAEVAQRSNPIDPTSGAKMG